MDGTVVTALLSISLVLFAGVRSQPPVPPIYLTTVNEFTFGNVGTLIELGGRFERTPGHMEIDWYTYGGNILYSDNNALFLLDRDTLIPSSIVGTEGEYGYTEGVGALARFNGFSDFAQISPTQVVIADSSNYCIRLLDRTNNQTSTLAGSCTNRGTADGLFRDARFSEVPQLVFDSVRNVIYVADGANNRLIRVLDLNTWRVSTLIALRPTPAFSRQTPTGVQLDPKRENLYVWGGGIFARINLATNTITHLNSQSSTPGFQDGPLSSAKFDNPSELLFLNEKTLLLVDSLNQGLRVINLNDNTVSSICLGGSASSIVDGVPTVTFPTPVNGDIETCRFRFPRSLLYLPSENRVLIGESGRIRSLAVTVAKPGRCPLYGHYGYSSCVSDAHCRGPMKCCYSHRHRRLACMYPVPWYLD